MYLFLIIFLIVLFLLGQRKEHMENHPTHPIVGPDNHPDLYDPTYKYPREFKHAKPGDDEEAVQPPPDDGTFQSDTATKQYSIYMYKPFAKLPFPTSPPPQPYLNDFSAFQR